MSYSSISYPSPPSLRWNGIHTNPHPSRSILLSLFLYYVLIMAMAGPNMSLARRLQSSAGTQRRSLERMFNMTCSIIFSQTTIEYSQMNLLENPPPRSTFATSMSTRYTILPSALRSCGTRCTIPPHLPSSLPRYLFLPMSAE